MNCWRSGVNIHTFTRSCVPSYIRKLCKRKQYNAMLHLCKCNSRRLLWILHHSWYRTGHLFTSCYWHDVLIIIIILQVVSNNRSMCNVLLLLLAFQFYLLN